MTLKEAVELQKEPFLQSLAESIRIHSYGNGGLEKTLRKYLDLKDTEYPDSSGSAVCRNRLRMAPHTAPVSANALTTPWLCQRDSVSAPLILITRWDGVNSVKAMR